MNNSISKVLVAITFLLSFTACNAQIKNEKTESVKIYGNCEKCESTIEKAGNIKKQSSVDWNKDTKMATISYDSLKISKQEILKRIALAGYDSDAFLAPDDTYSSLPECCQYERAKKTIFATNESVVNMEITDHSAHNMPMESKAVNQMTSIYDNYFALKDALVKTDKKSASTNATNLLTAINSVKMDQLSNEVHMVWMKVLEPLKKETQAIADGKDIETQRNHLNALSKEIYTLLEVSKTETPTFYQFCPMANGGKGANWLSKEEAIKNPYYGSQMLGCGKTVETIKE